MRLYFVLLITDQSTNNYLIDQFFQLNNNKRLAMRAITGSWCRECCAVTQGNYNHSNNNATALNSPSSNGALNKVSSVSFCNPSHANDATDCTDALSPGVDLAKFRFRTLSLLQHGASTNHPPTYVLVRYVLVC